MKATFEKVAELAAELNRSEQLKLVERLSDGLTRTQKAESKTLLDMWGCLSGVIDDEYYKTLDELRHGTKTV